MVERLIECEGLRYENVKEAKRERERERKESGREVNRVRELTRV